MPLSVDVTLEESARRQYMVLHVQPASFTDGSSPDI